MKAFIKLAILCSLIPVMAQAGYLSFSNTWVRAVPPTSKMTAAYATITNTSDKTVYITGAGSQQFGYAELHETIMEENAMAGMKHEGMKHMNHEGMKHMHHGGMARMVQQGLYKIEAGQTIELKQGGRHIMLFHPVNPLQEGDNSQIDLLVCQFDSHGRCNAEAESFTTNVSRTAPGS